MNFEEVKRFNVYSQTYSGKNPVYYLESFNGSYWKSVTHSGNAITYYSLDTVAKRIVEIAPYHNCYKRVIFENKPLDKEDGKLEGIDFNDGKPYLIDSLSRQDKLDLLERIQKYFNEKK